MAHVPLSGSERTPLSGAKCIGGADPGETLQAMLVLRRQGLGEFHDLADKVVAGHAAAPLSRQAFADKFGAAPSDFAKVARFARRYGLVVVRQDPASGTVVLDGTVAQFDAAFQITLQRYQHAGGRTGAVTDPCFCPKSCTAS